MKGMFLNLLLVSACLAPQVAFAGDAATIIFKSGQVVKVEDGYRQVLDAMKSLNYDDKRAHVVEFNIGGGGFLLNVAEVAIVCRDACTGLTIQHQLDPKRGGAKAEIEIHQGAPQ